MKKAILLASILLPGLFTNAQSNKEQYAAAISKVQLFYNNQYADSLFNMFSTSLKTALPLEKTKEMMVSLATQVGKLNNTTASSINNDVAIYKGNFEKIDLNIFIKLDEENKMKGLSCRPIKKENETQEPAKVYDNNFNVLTPQGDTLYGTLTLPATQNTKVPIVLFIAGSGPTDRDGNNILGVESDAFKMLSDSLSEAGIASVRYDKRGVGASIGSMKKEEDLRFHDMVNDAVLFIQKIKTYSRFNKIIIAGHSEGSLVGMIAANKEKADKFISISGPGENVADVLSRQLKASGTTLSADGDKIIESLKKGKTIAVENENLKNIFHSGVQPYLISLFSYDPRTEIKKLSIPILIVQGNTDLQVSVEDAQNLSKAQPKARLVIVEQMNHVLKTVSNNRAENLATYGNPDLPIDSDFTNLVIDFCLKNN